MIISFFSKKYLLIFFKLFLYLFVGRLKRDIYMCRFCQKILPSPSVLAKHERIHTGEKPYSCEICGKRFSDPSSWRRHKRVHIEETPYNCEICLKGFKRNRDLQNHIRQHTTH